MTYASVLSRFNAYKLDAVLIISGIPTLFGTRAGRTHDGTGVNQPYPGTWASVAAWDVRSFKQGESTLDKLNGYVKPSTIGLELFKNSAWNSYFHRRTLPQPVLTADINETATTITLNDTTGLDGGNYLYINRETILIGNVASSTSLTGCTRNAIGLAGDAAACHQAGTTCGVTPRHLIGREATLRIFLGEGDSTYQDIIGLRITESPRDNTSRGVWELAFDDGMQRFARKIAVNMQGATVQILGTTVVSGELMYQMTFQDRTELGFANGNAAGDLGHIMLTCSGSGVHGGGSPIVTTFTQPSAGVINVPAAAFTGDLTNGVSPVTYDFARRVYVFTGSPMESALKVLLSDSGNGDNDASYDVLAGPITSTGGTGSLTDATSEKRLGAAIPPALLDLTTSGLKSRDLITRSVPGWCYILGGRGPEDLLAFMCEVAWAMGGFWYTTLAGQLSFKFYDAAYPNDVETATITEGQLVRDCTYTSVDDEKDVLHSVNLECNFALVDNSAHGHFTSISPEARETYRDLPGGSITVARKGMLVDLPGMDATGSVSGGQVLAQPGSILSARGVMIRIYVKREKGTLKYLFDCPWKYSPLVAGNLITVTHPKFNAFNGSGLSSTTLQVMSKQPDMAKQRVKLTCEDTWAAKIIAPTARISAWSGAGPYTLTLTANSTKFNLGASPTSYFAAGWVLEIHQYGTAAARYATKFLFTVTSITNGTVMVGTATTTFTPAAGDIVCFRGYPNAASAVANTAQGMGQRAYAFMSDDNFLLNAVDAAELWG